MRNFFWADLHFHHYLMAKMRGYCDVDEKDPNVLETATLKMNDTMIGEWNSVVTSKDTIYHGGDLCLGSKQQTQSIISRLNGNICLLRGDHDRYVDGCSGINWVKDVYMFKSPSTSGLALGGNIFMWLSHYAHRRWPRAHYGSLHVYGHSHGKLYDDPCSLSMDVGYDTSETKKPYSLEEIICLLDMKIV